MLIDSHCHINSLPNNIKEEILLKPTSGYIFNDVSIDLMSALKSLEISKDLRFVYTSLGFHPFTEEEFSQSVIAKYRSLIKTNKKIIAIGEVGLDYKAKISAGEQEKIFEEFIKLSKETDLPLIIHNRWQDDYLFSILDRYFSNYDNLIFHCFSQGKDFLNKVICRGGLASFSLNILRKNKVILESLKQIPLKNLLLETDSPYMRISGVPSTPLDIEAVYDFVSFEKSIALDELKIAVDENFKKIFNLSEAS